MKLPSQVKQLLTPQVIKTFSSKYNSDIKLISFAGKLRLDMGGLIQSGQIMQDIWGKALTKILPKDYTPNSFLLLGFGTGSSAKEIVRRWPDTKITGVEIDPVVIEIAKEHFQVGDMTNLNLVNQDAVKFVGGNKDHYSVTLVDCYQGYDTPKGLETIKILTKLKKDSEYLLLNRLYWGGHRSRTHQFLERLEKHFKVTTLRTPSNLILALE